MANFQVRITHNLSHLFFFLYFLSSFLSSYFSPFQASASSQGFLFQGPLERVLWVQLTPVPPLNYSEVIFLTSSDQLKKYWSGHIVFPWSKNKIIVKKEYQNLASMRWEYLWRVCEQKLPFEIWVMSLLGTAA